MANVLAIVCSRIVRATLATRSSEIKEEITLLLENAMEENHDRQSNNLSRGDRERVLNYRSGSFIKNTYDQSRYRLEFYQD